ncbi:hypothetical protein JS82_00615 [Methanomassiliicoccaceae archaeon DOK]|nr:hypothetical protein JS82_00615 [Methanomassiliicoccaceae archaeon DOK]
MVRGHNTNGWIEWRTDDGIILDEVLRMAPQNE